MWLASGALSQSHSMGRDRNSFSPHNNNGGGGGFSSSIPGAPSASHTSSSPLLIGGIPFGSGLPARSGSIMSQQHDGDGGRAPFQPTSLTGTHTPYWGTLPSRSGSQRQRQPPPQQQPQQHNTNPNSHARPMTSSTRNPNANVRTNPARNDPRATTTRPRGGVSTYYPNAETTGDPVEDDLPNSSYYRSHDGPADLSAPSFTQQQRGQYQQHLPAQGAAAGNRSSTQTTRTTNTDGLTESDMSPFVSPTSSSLAGKGLAPRPPSMPYGSFPDPAGQSQKRQNSRGSRQVDELEDLLEDPPTPQPQGDHVRSGPPVSYRDPSGGGARSSRSSAGGHASGPADDEAHYTIDSGEHSQANPNADSYFPPQSQRRPRGAPVSGSSSHARTRSVSSSGVYDSQRDNGKPRKDPSTRKVSADVRSPLQKLELTLDSISKEEKRARVEAAEQKARDRAAAADKAFDDEDDGDDDGDEDYYEAPQKPPQAVQQPVQQSQYQREFPEETVTAPRPQQQQVRFRDGIPIHEHIIDNQWQDTPSHHAAAPGPREPSPLDEPVDDRRHGWGSHNSWKPSASQQPRPPHQTSKGVAFADPEEYEVQDQRAAQSSLPRRNMSFKDRTNKDESQARPPRPRSPSSPPGFAPANSRWGSSLTRAPTNKLRKEPPGDPWFSRRMEMEKKYGSPTAMNAAMDRSADDMGGRDMPQPAANLALNKPLPPNPDGSRDIYEDPNLDYDMPYQKARKNSGSASKAAKLLGLGGIERRKTAPAAARGGFDEGDSPRFAQRQAGGRMRYASASGRSPRDFDQYSLSQDEEDDTGDGEYQPPAFLEEWKTAPIGQLHSAYMDLSREEPPAVDKNKAWWEGSGKRQTGMNSAQRTADALEGGYADMNIPTRFKPPLYLKCGPLLRYTGIRRETTRDREIWRGSVMIVTRDSDSSYEIVPSLRLFAQPINLLPPPPQEISGEEHLSPEYVDPIAGLPKLGRRGETLFVRPVDHLDEARDISMIENDEGLFSRTRSPAEHAANEASVDPSQAFPGLHKKVEADGEKLSKYKDVRGFRLHQERDSTFWRFNIEVELGDTQQRIAYRINKGPAMGFWVPARDQSMNIMFHSCNGFAMGINPNDYSGPDPMWRDVLNNHQTRPFHVMVGGGDQVYNDCILGESKHFNRWLDIREPDEKRYARFTAGMQDELESLYLERYCKWFSQGLFGLANSQIPMVNMWDDHDISDGYGSYPHEDQNCPVFCGLGAVAFKYYMLFQHQSVPSETEEYEPSWLLGQKPGPYINEFSRSLFLSLGSKVALLAVDARTERTEQDVVSGDTWKLVMDRCYEEIKNGKTEHLLVLMGVPLAYPRLVWLENILTSRLMNPVKAMGKLGLLGNALNGMDGGAEVMDDFNDHWTAKNHKRERAIIVEDLQDLAADRSLRVTILSGDVHLAAVGQFYANPKLGLPKHRDFRYMPNIISSAIANAPPPNLLADTLNKRDKVHHFDESTEESMIPLFRDGVNGKPRKNRHLLPHRNWCAIREWQPGATPPPTPPMEYEADDSVQHDGVRRSGSLQRKLTKTRGGPREEGQESRPPIAGESRFGSLVRRLSGRRPSISSGKSPARTMSLTRGDFNPKNLFRSRRGSQSKRNDGGINGQWGQDSDDEYDAERPTSPRRGQSLDLNGAAHQNEFTPGDEAAFTARTSGRVKPQQPADPSPQDKYHDDPPIRPLFRAPTDLTLKQVKKRGAEAFEVNLDGGLDVTFNVEVNPRDPAGITVPYRLVIPRLFWDDVKDSAALQDPQQQQQQQQPQWQQAGPPPTGFKRFLSFKKKYQQPPAGPMERRPSSASQPPTSTFQDDAPYDVGSGAGGDAGGSGAADSGGSVPWKNRQSAGIQPSAFSRQAYTSYGASSSQPQQQQQQRLLPNSMRMSSGGSDATHPRYDEEAMSPSSSYSMFPRLPGQRSTSSRQSQSQRASSRAVSASQQPLPSRGLDDDYYDSAGDYEYDDERYDTPTGRRVS